MTGGPGASLPVRMALMLASALAGTLLLATPSPAQQADESDVRAEYSVKAAFLYNFGRYVEWPLEAFPSPADPFVIVVFGDAPLVGVLEAIAARKTISGRKIILRRYASAAEYRPPCHMLFVSRALSAEQQADVVRITQGTGVLSVGEAKGFVERGGIINFFVDGGRVHFEINVDAANRARLQMDAKLLSLGKRAQDRTPSPDDQGRGPLAAQTAPPP